jgi:hypothetical protein
MGVLNIEKAHDTVWLAGLLFKLISFYLPDYLLFFLKSYLEGRTFTVHLNDTTSTPKATLSGLSQGAVLSTTLFSLYTSDMPHTHFTLYADDTALRSQSWRLVTITRRPSNAITILRQYFTTWKFRLNTHKNENILFSKRRPASRTLFKSRTTLCPGFLSSAI